MRAGAAPPWGVAKTEEMWEERDARPQPTGPTLSQMATLLPSFSSATSAAAAAASEAGGQPPAASTTRPRALCLYVFDRAGTALHYAEWHRPKPVSAGAGSPADDAKMMFGLLFSLRTLAAAVDPLR